MGLPAGRALMWLAFTLVACVAFGSGAALQKHGLATKLPDLGLRALVREPGRVVRGVFGNPVWLGGLGVNLLGGVFMILAVRAGEISVVQPLVNLNILVAVLAGVFALGERLARAEWVGVLATVGGAALLSTSAPGPSSVAPDPTALWLSAAGSALVAVALAAGGRALRGLVAPEFALAAAAGILYGLGTVVLKVLTLRFDEGGPLAARLGTMLLSPELWVFVAVNVAGFVLYQLAFARGRVAVVAPVTTIASVFAPVAAGVLAFSEHMDGLRAVGIAVVAGGTALLVARRPAPSAQPD